jgi:hypothetical protein
VSAARGLLAACRASDQHLPVLDSEPPVHTSWFTCPDGAIWFLADGVGAVTSEQAASVRLANEKATSSSERRDI